jgi:endonuclease YncB( thermonuclease family)
MHAALVLIVIVISAGAVHAGAALPPPVHRHPVRPSLGPHTVGAGAVRVHDGDTFSTVYGKVRLRGVDAPELHDARGEAARRRLAALLASGPITIVPRLEDIYGRTVADVYVGGRNVAAVLCAEGFDKPRVWRPRRVP